MRWLSCAVFIAMTANPFLLEGLSGQTLDQFKRFNEYNMQPEVWHFAGPVQGQVDEKGDLNLSVPLLTVPGSNELNFDVNLSYKAGIRYHQTASWVGLGWNLDAAEITRDVQSGITVGGTEYGVDYNDDPGTYLFMPDAYYVTIRGKGTLTMSRSNLPNFNIYLGSGFLAPYNSGQFFFEEHRPYKIEYVLSNNYDWPLVDPNLGMHEDIIQFTITTDDGTRYIYGLPSLGIYEKYNAVEMHYPNVWRLLAIASREFTGNINLLLQPPIYDAAPPGPSQAYADLGGYTGWIKFEYTFDDTTIFSTEVASQSNLIQNTYMKWVITPTHYAEFITDGPRTDIDLQHYAENTNDISSHYKRLSSIRLNTRSGLFVKEVDLTHDYSLCADQTGIGRLTLKGIVFKSYDNQVLPGYSFEYVTGSHNPAFSFISTDHYYDGLGYYNDESQPPFGVDSNTEDGQAWCLKKVTYPSGGTETFSYENDFIDDGPIIYQRILFDGTTENRSFDFDNWNSAFSCRRQGGIRVTGITRTDGMGNS